MPDESEVKREGKAGPEAADESAGKGQQGSRFKQIKTGPTGWAGVVTAQRSVTSADGFSVQPTTKLDGFTAVYSEFLLTAGYHIPNDGKKVVGGIGADSRQVRPRRTW